MISNHSGRTSPFASAILPLALVGVITIFYLATIRLGHVWGDDHAQYIHHAKNIALGLRYIDTGYVLSPTSLNPQMYPPIFPLVLAPVYHWYGLALTPMKVECICFLAIALYFLCLLFKNESSLGLALATVALVGFCPYFWDLKDTLISEYPFLAFTYAALYIAQRSERTGDSGKSGVAFGAAVGLLAYLSYGTRTVGFLVIVAVLLRNFLTRRKLTSFSVTAGAVFALGVVAQKVLLVASPDYAGSFARIVTLRSFLGSPWWYFKTMATLWDNGRSAPLGLILYSITTVLALYGAWVRFRQKWTSLDFFAVFYVLFIIWFPWGGKRYLMPIMPFYIFYVFVGLQSFAAGYLPSTRVWLQTGLVAAIIAGYVSKYTTLNWVEVPNGMQAQGVAQMVQYVQKEIGPTGLVVFEKPRFLSLYSETRSADIYEVNQCDTMLDFYRRVGVTHLIIPRNPAQEDTRFLTKLVSERPALFEKKFDNGAFAVYRLK
jgi:hypothetical protein